MKQTLANRIREARTQRGLDQGKLAAKLDIATRTLQRWEKGEQVPDSNDLIRLAKATGVGSHWLLTGEGSMYVTEYPQGKILPLQTGRYKKVDLISLPLLSSVPGGAPKKEVERSEEHTSEL